MKRRKRRRQPTKLVWRAEWPDGTGPYGAPRDMYRLSWASLVNHHGWTKMWDNPGPDRDFSDWWTAPRYQHKESWLFGCPTPAAAAAWFDADWLRHARDRGGLRVRAYEVQEARVGASGLQTVFRRQGAQACFPFVAPSLPPAVRQVSGVKETLRLSRKSFKVQG